MDINNEIKTIMDKINSKKITGFIKSPINYTGNKFRILSQILPYMNKEHKVFVDLFCGGATVGLNVNSSRVIFIDNDPRVIGLLKHLSKYEFKSFLKDALEIVHKYELSLSSVYGYSSYKELLIQKNSNNGLKEYNSSGFYKLRDDYNSIKNKNSKKAYTYLYILMVYSFNNDMRFSKTGKFNLPVGKTDLNLNNLIKVKRFIEKINSGDFEFYCSGFNEISDQAFFKEAEMIYMDPPYLITNAVYNETNKWNNQKEYELLGFIDNLILESKAFILSNVIEKKGFRNEPLCYWTELNKQKIKIISIDYHYRSSSYNKLNRNLEEKEVIIMSGRFFDDEYQQ